MRKLALLSGAVGIMALFAVSCGDDDDATADDSGSAVRSSAGGGPGISIEEALSSDLDGPLLVNGFLFVRGGEHDDPEVVRLCEALAESYPPQCGGASLIVEGLGLKSIEGIVSEGPVSWIENYVQILGIVDGDFLIVSPGTESTIPLPTSTPPTDIIRSTGDATLDSLTEIILSKDFDQLVSLTEFWELECTNEVTLGGGVPCRNEETEGTLVGVVSFSSCEGNPIRHDGVADLLEHKLIEAELHLHSVVRLREPPGPAFAPRGEFGVIVEYQLARGPERGMMFEFSENDNLVSVYQGCALTASDILARLTNPELIVPLLSP